MKEWRKEEKTIYKDSCAELEKMTECVLAVYSRGKDSQNTKLRKENEGRMRGRRGQNKER